MLLMSHTSMGIFIASISSDPILGSTCSFMSHYLLDIIPHEPKDELFYVPAQKSKWTEEIKNKLRNRKNTSIADLLFSITLIAAYIYFKKLFWFNQLAFLCIILFFSLLPDIMTIIYLRYPFKILAKHYDLHFKIHKIIPIHMSYTTAAGYQIVFSIGLVCMALIDRIL
jgi:hypothetical protein